MNMTMGSALPDWVTPVAWLYITLSLLSAVVIGVDIYLLRHRHESIASELVWLPANLILLCDDCHSLMHPGVRDYPWFQISKGRTAALHSM